MRLLGNDLHLVKLKLDGGLAAEHGHAFTALLSTSTLSTVPVKEDRGPSKIRTVSPTA